ncbi:phage replisome organizer N-terminal domain-containing protein [Mediterraneibacter agrestimuris]|uniref:phage replisome organizer N-terminal domain-containing protein n=1 Tax=Mediterraneibacter agrestimuris TaxID=2941333 RepID=UPI00203D6745|nr:phage replisome organizer N-terminal domain-containing protein [Mediterraneibacter agrestimuris]
MAAEKRLFWLQLKNTYFNQLSQKKMRKQSQGLEMQVIYLRMMLLSLDNKGYIFYQGVYDSIEEELAEEFNEPLELVKQTIDFLIENKMVTTEHENDSLFIPEALDCTGSESASAKRVREYRERKMLQCNSEVTEYNGNVTKCNSKDKSKNKVREEKELENTLFNSLTLKEGDTLPPSADAGGASPFTLIDCQECADEGKVNLSEDGIQAFYNRMEKDGWKIKGEPVTNLLLAMRGFAKNHKRYQKQKSESAESTQQRQKTQKKSNPQLERKKMTKDYMRQYGLLDEDEGE